MKPRFLLIPPDVPWYNQVEALKLQQIGGVGMGMTNEQFKTHLIVLISQLKKALQSSPDNEELKELIKNYEEALKL